jgi:hypothetical protein
MCQAYKYKFPKAGVWMAQGSDDRQQSNHIANQGKCAVACHVNNHCGMTMILLMPIST